MPETTPKAAMPTFRERMDEVERLRYMLLIKGISQADAAKHIRRSTKTVCLWVKRYGIREELVRQKAKQQSIRALKMDTSLPVFAAFVRIHHPQQYQQLQQLLKDFQQSS